MISTPFPAPPPTYPLQREVPQPTPRALPRSILAACVLWIVYGAISLAIGLPLAANGFVLDLVGLAFLGTAIPVLRGRVSQVRGAGAACIALAVVSLLVYAVWLSALGKASNWLPGWVTWVAMLDSLVLATAGVLALVGNRAYKDWRAARR